jgi:hypothetical protein
MIGGHVTRHRWAIVTIELIDTSGGIVQVDAVVDTGFTGDLTLPPEMSVAAETTNVSRIHQANSTQTTPDECPGDGAGEARQSRLDRKPSRPRQAAPKPPSETPFIDQLLVPLTTRLQPRTANALRRAYLEQKLKHARPSTQQEIIEAAVQEWLRKSGYLDD